MDVFPLTLSNYIASFIQKKYNIDNYGYQIISTLILKMYSFMTNAEVDFTIVLQHYKSIIALILIIIIIYNFKNYKSLKNDKLPNDDQYKHIFIINDISFLQNLNDYMDINKSIFKTNKVNVKSKTVSNTKIYIYTEKVEFNDPIYGGDGYIEFVEESKEVITLVNKEKNITYVDIININISINTTNGELYDTHINNFILIHKNNSNLITLNYYKFCKISYIFVPFYNGTQIKLDEENKQLYKTYFSQYRYIVDSFLKSPSTYSNILLYGPPGVGKSKLAYLCARFLKCSIVNIDLSLYVNKKSLLFQIFNGMKFNPTINKNYPIGEFSATFSSQRKCIILLEEVDYAIEKILNHSKKQKEKDNAINKKETSESIILDKMVEDEEDILEISDLLELFQGAVPMTNRIIIATTNNLSSINNLIPALLRPGRLTPILIDYITWKILNEITQYYYNQTMTCEPFNIKIPTSQIIEDITIYIQQNKSFQEFQDHLLSFA